MSDVTDHLRWLRPVALTEAITYLALVAASIAHRGFGSVNLVPIVGGVHGVVFLLYLAIAFSLRKRLNWDSGTMIVIVLASVVPLGTAVVENRISRNPLQPRLMHGGLFGTAEHRHDQSPQT